MTANCDHLRKSLHEEKNQEGILWQNNNWKQFKKWSRPDKVERVKTNTLKASTISTN